MELFLQQLTQKYNWDRSYASDAVKEYNRFMILRSQNHNLSPADDIDKVWHQHIIDTKNYASYCKKFDKFIHHDPADALDQSARKIRLKNTIQAYKQTFHTFINPNVWGIVLSSPKNNTEIKIAVFYTFDTGNGHRIWKKNDNTFDSKTIYMPITTSSTIHNIRKYVSEITGHNIYAIKIYPEHLKNIIHDPKSIEPDSIQKKLADDMFISKSKNLSVIAVLEEMTSNGYC